MKNDLENVIEAILFAVGRGVSKEEIANTLLVNVSDVENAILKLEDKYKNEIGGISLVKVNNTIQLVSNKKYYNEVTKFIENSKKENLTPTCLEVLSIIAYNPKITKSEIENIRGVNSDSQVSRLLEYGLIEEVGRLKLPGRPAIFSVTNEFLRSMGIENVCELPDFDKIKSSDEELNIFKEESVETNTDEDIDEDIDKSIIYKKQEE